VGGSTYPMVFSTRLAAVTKKRTAELAYLKCGEGDLGCPVPGQ
jgi:hypothetical protein